MNGEETKKVEANDGEDPVQCVFNITTEDEKVAVNNNIETNDATSFDGQVENEFGELIDSDSMHCYLGKIFEFKIVSEEENREPIFHEKSFDAAQIIDTSKKNNKLDINGKTPLQILHEYSQKELKMPVGIQQNRKALTTWFLHGNCH